MGGTSSKKRMVSIETTLKIYLFTIYCTLGFLVEDWQVATLNTPVTHKASPMSLTVSISEIFCVCQENVIVPSHSHHTHTRWSSLIETSAIDLSKQDPSNCVALLKKILRYMKLCRVTQLHMLALETVSHRDMKMCRMILFLEAKLCRTL